MHDLHEWLEGQNGGIRTYIEFQQKTLRLARQDSGNAAIWALLGAISARFIAQFEGEPLPVDQANAAIGELRALLTQADKVLAQPAADRLAFANRIATLNLSGVAGGRSS